MLGARFRSTSLFDVQWNGSGGEDVPLSVRVFDLTLPAVILAA